jgi:uncharacterized protein (TIGR03905 family)
VPTFIPKGVCSVQIDFEIDDEGLLRDVHFTQGCPGNAEGMARLAEGRPAAEVAKLLEGLPCGQKPTSCPDQFARALSQELDKRAAR